MSDINANAMVTLTVNGKQAQNMLEQLKRQASDLEDKITKAAAAGDKVQLKKFQRELKQTRRQIGQIESATQGVENVMKRLDKASPKELSRTLKELKKSLNGIERGTDEWKKQCESIKRVKAEIANVNEELRETEKEHVGLVDRINGFVDKWGNIIAGVAAVGTGLVMAGRKAVNAFAEMDAEMANVRKFTGLADDEVKELNEDFKRMDTRTSREDLNKLAEEAGRLGKSSKEDVLGFVKAADQINVALDELGDGATLTLSKLTNIFGDEARLGTERSLLAVGSVINDLSQNCTASAGYLAEFGKRMAGVGAQAGMTIPQIMAFAAVLDSQGQACEMSATALSQLIMNLFKEPSKIAKATGMDLDELNKALKRSTNEGLLMLLQKLKELGNMDVLAPVFKNMGENGARASQVLATLAGNVEMVKWQQEQATQSFEDATSVTNEFNVQNSTVEAELDKAKKRVTELAIELGEKLMPVMKHVISTTTLTLKAMSTTIDFLARNKEAIIVLTSMVVAYTIAVKANAIALKAQATWHAVCKGTAIAYHAVVNTLQAGHIAFNLVLAKLQGNWARQSSLMVDLKRKGLSLASGWGILLAAAVALGYGIYKTLSKMNEMSASEKALAEVRQKGQEGIVEEKNKIEALIKVAKDEKLSLDDRQKAVNALNKIIPNYNAQLDATTGKYMENKKALDDYLKSLAKKYELEGAKDLLKEIGKEKAKLAMELKEADDAIEKDKRINASSNFVGGREGRAMDTGAATYTAHLKNNKASIQRKIDEQNQKEHAIFDVYGNDLGKQAAEETNHKPVVTNNGGGGGGVPVVDDDKKNKKSDKFKVEQDWQKEQNALNKKAYMEGEKNYEAYVERMEEIEQEYYARILKNKKITKEEKAEAEANLAEAKKKQSDRKNSPDDWKATEEAKNRIAYAKGEKDYEQYTARMDEINVQYWKKKMERSDVSAKDLLEAQAQYQEAMKKQEENATSASREREDKAYNAQLAELKQRYIDGLSDTKTYENAVELLELEHLRKVVQLYKKGTQERLAAEKEYQNKVFANQQKIIQRQQQVKQQLKEEYFGMNADERLTKYDSDMAALEQVYHAEVKAAGDNAAEKLRIEEAFEKAKLALRKKYAIDSIGVTKNGMEKANEKLANWLESDAGQAVTQSFSTVMSGMGEIFSGVSSLVQAELEKETAAINARYSAEISAAEGNNYKVAKLEKEKQAALAKAKNEANKKLFAMQVIQAVAQTAQNAISAYGSAAAIPVVGYIMAPIAAAMAIAAGMIQIAAIKKQQQASEAQGYAQGGFTPQGRVNEEVGVVHAGEWVASQKLLASPVARPLINALDHAQRTNTIGSLRAEDVSRSIGGANAVAPQSVQPIVVQAPTDNMASAALAQSAAVLSKYEKTMSQLSKRLNEPFVTVNTVTGDTGIKQAQEEYDTLIRNKSPKSRRK
ncbi:phage tail tape measure protein [Prevotellamassilia timonensis]|uniref:phage tail tape measure protein n=1 Tax=Prevotellamassilia timonensis TaxID=1852370 RepID=UPI004028A664